MQGETNQQSIMRSSVSPHDSGSEGYSEDHAVTEEGYILQNDKDPVGIDDSGNDEGFNERASSNGSGCNEAPLPPEPEHQMPIYEERDVLEKPEITEQVLHQYPDPNHSIPGSSTYKPPENYGFYSEVHAFNVGGNSQQHSVPSVQPGSWACTHPGLPYPGCEEHPYTHGYFIMPCYPGPGYPFMHGHVPGGKPAPEALNDVNYPENGPFVEPIPLTQFNFSYVEQGRSWPRMMNIPSSTAPLPAPLPTPAPGYVYSEMPMTKPQGLPPIWPSFGEKIPENVKIVSGEGQIEYSMADRDSSQEVHHPTQNYQYIPTGEPNGQPTTNDLKSKGHKRQRSRKDPAPKISNKGGLTANSCSYYVQPAVTNSSELGLLPSVCKWLVPSGESDKDQICDEHFSTPVDLAKHISTDHVYRGDKQMTYICLWEGCQRQNRPFKARYKLVNHLRVHTGERPYKCAHPGCERTFARTENLKIHARGHSGEKPYPCPFPGCERKFSNSSDRKKHQRAHELRT